MLRTCICLFWGVVLVLALTPAAAHGEGAPPGLTGGNLIGSNASLLGQADGDHAYQVAGAGDVNGDGYDDLIIGASGYSNGTGRAYLFLGGPAGWGLNLGLQSADAIYTGEGAGNSAGYSVAGAGDVNGDGFDDLLIGAPGYASHTGRVYLVLGSSSPAGIGLGSAHAVYTGESAASGYAGNAVAGAGDVNGDGYDDLLIGAFGFNNFGGRTYLVFGAQTPQSNDLGNRAIHHYDGAAQNYRSGNSVAGVGDVNGDGYDDLLIGAPWLDGSAGYSQGAAYLILGSQTPSSHTLTDADIHFDGETDNDRAGQSVSGAGDVNGDGYADLLIGAPDWGAPGNTPGRAYLVLGSSEPRTIVLYHADAIYEGESSGDSAGQDVSGAGDVNADGYDDLLIGASGYDDRYAGGNYVDWNAGAAYLVLGSSNPTSIGLGSADAFYIGEEENDQAGYDVSGAGDVNGDGYSDLAIAAQLADSAYRGKTYLLFSDYNSAEGTRYRAIQRLSDAPVEVGHSGVAAAYGDRAVVGWLFITRHFRNTCSTNFDTNGLLWTVESQRGAGSALFTFKYNDSQIVGWNEANLKLYYRERPCDEWTEVGGAVLDIATNRINTGGAVQAFYHEYTIAPSQPSPTALGQTSMGVTLAQEPPLLVIGLALLCILTPAAQWWARRMRSRGASGL